MKLSSASEQCCSETGSHSTPETLHRSRVDPWVPQRLDQPSTQKLSVALQEEDSPEVAALKEQLLALMLAMSERLDSVEAVQEQHQGAIEVSLQVTRLVKPACCCTSVEQGAMKQGIGLPAPSQPYAPPTNTAKKRACRGAFALAFRRQHLVVTVAVASTVQQAVQQAVLPTPLSLHGIPA